MHNIHSRYFKCGENSGANGVDGPYWPLA
jgi:hypothetical protein